jgi:predicted dehydrogenase
MCTVPMATTLEEAQEIVGLVRESGLKYMMAETVVYSREFLFIKEMHDKGELGRIQYLQASHPQDMEGWPDYWKDMVPMHYATHVVSPLMALVGGMAEYVSCFGSGAVNDEIAHRRSRLNPAISRSRIPTWPLMSGASSGIQRGSIARASTFMAPRSHSSGN